MSRPDGQRTRGWASRHEVALFLVLAYGLSWSIWPLVLLNPDSSPLVPFGPGLAAVLVAPMVGGRRELVGLLRQLGRWRVDAKWYGVALAIPLAIPAAAYGMALTAGAQARRMEPSDVLQVAGTLLVTLVIVGLFEEVGWRGFLLPRLQRSRDALTAALIVGLAWLPWHLPEMVSDPGQRPIAQFSLYIFAQSVLLAWLYNSTRASLPIVMVFHAALNSFASFFLSALEGGNGYQAAWWTLAGLSAVVALIVIVYSGTRTLAKNHAAVGALNETPSPLR